MRFLAILYVCFMVTPQLATSQSSSTRIAGLQEPPELTGEPKKLTQPSDTLRQFASVMDKWKENDPDAIKALRPELDSFVQQHPGYANAYALRALADACYINTKNYESIMADMNKAVAALPSDPDGQMFTLADLNAYRAKVDFNMGRYREAMDDLEAAMKAKIDEASKIFNSQGTKPDAKASPCAWTTSEIDTLAQRFPKDYRVPVFRGLYLSFFTTFDKTYYQQAIQEFQKAATLNPRSPLPHYFIGKTHFSSSLWATSDTSTNEAIRKAILEFTAALMLDPKFLPAYELRAAEYLQLKQYPQAIRDYNKVLELDPENVTAYADRGLSKLDSGQYLGATFDLGEAISREKNEDALTLGRVYEYRADAYLKMDDYRRAIADLTKALELKIGSQGFVFGLGQYRALYPEYAGISDEALIRKLNKQFWPQYEYDVMAKQFSKQENELAVLGLSDLFEKRGDAYLRSGDFRLGVNDFNRIYRGIPNSADTVERWRPLGSGPGGDNYFVDVKTVEFSNSKPSHLWLKTVNKNANYVVESYDIDCKTRRLQTTATVAYDKLGKVVSSSEVSSGWQRITPATRGEQLFDGMCSAKR